MGALFVAVVGVELARDGLPHELQRHAPGFGLERLEVVKSALADQALGFGAADMFVFEAGHGTDTITDFNDGEDLLDLTALTDITAFNDLTITADGTTAVIDLTSQGGGTIRVENTAGNDLDEEDFCFYEAPSEGDGM